MVLEYLDASQYKFATFFHQMGDTHTYLTCDEFELRTPGTPFIGSHPSTLAPSSWYSFFRYLVIYFFK